MRIVAPSHFQTPNDLVDHWLPQLGEAEVKVLLVVFRKTFGWHKEKDQISLSQFQTLTGLNRTNTCRAINSLIDKGILQKEIAGILGTERVFYSLVVEDSNNSYQYRSGTPPSTDAVPPLVPERYPQKKITKETTQKKQQQEKSAAVSFHECLKKTEIPDPDKEWLTRHYSEEEILRAIQWAQHSQTKLNKPLAAALKWACKNKPEIPKDKVDSEKANRDFAISTETKFKHAQYKLHVLTKHIEIVHDTGVAILVLNYKEKGFKEQFLNALRKIGVYLK